MNSMIVWLLIMDDVTDHLAQNKQAAGDLNHFPASRPGRMRSSDRKGRTSVLSLDLQTVWN